LDWPTARESIQRSRGELADLIGRLKAGI